MLPADPESSLCTDLSSHLTIVSLAAVLEHAKGVAKKAHSLYMASNNAYYLANDRAVYDDRAAFCVAFIVFLFPTQCG